MRDHVEEGDLQAWLDDELRGESAHRVGRHLEQCASCRDRAALLRDLHARVVQGLLPLDALGELPEARRAVLRRRAAGTARAAGASAGSPAASGGARVKGGEGVVPLEAHPRFRGRPGWSRRRSTAAAAVLVLVAGGAAALPGSPVREWLGGLRTSAPAPAPSAAAVEEAPSGVAVGLRDGRVELVLRSPPPGTEVEVRVGGEERVEVQAPPGTRYASAPGRVELDLAEAGEGPLLVLIPGFAREVLLSAERRPLMSWSGGTFRLEEGISAETRGEGLLLRIPDTPSAGGGAPSPGTPPPSP